MADTVEQIARGDLERRAEVVTNDEIGDLARSFNTMVGTLQLAQHQLEDLNRALEHRVEERTVALLDEIEERKRIETALRSSEDRLHTVVEHLPEGVLLLDADLVVLLANPAAAALTGPAGLAAPGERLESVAGTPLARLSASDGWLEVITGETPRRVLEVTVRELGDPGARGGRIVVLRDVTQERDTQEQLRQSDRLASLGQLASGIAHDFRNILQGIMMSAELMLVEDRLSPHAKQEELESILKHGRRGASLITQILDFSRRSTSTRTRLDLTQVLGAAAPMLRRLIPEAVEIGLDLPDEPLIIIGDATQLQQVIVNLALNARDAMPSGGTLEMRLTRLPPDRAAGLLGAAASPAGGSSAGSTPAGHAAVPGAAPRRSWICLEVRDTGDGIPLSVRDHVFEPFFTTKAPGSGTGLGLAQVYGIVHQHSGQVLFDSQEGRGTTFRVLLPEVPRSPARLEPDPAPAALPAGSGQRILLVEDEASLRSSLRKGLEALGYTVLEAATGVDALGIWSRHRDDIALVLSDVIMPAMGGIELIRQLGPGQPPVPIVLMSGHPLEADDHAAMLRAGIPLIEKPVPLEVLAKVVAGALGRGVREG
jgi:signal transduction histidine kinase